MPLTTQDRKFIKKTLQLAEKSKCLRKKVAAMLVKKGKILAQATNDPLPKYDCKKMGCIRDQMKIPHGHRREICYGICAEMYVISQVAKKNIHLNNATLYVTIHPCKVCECLIAQSGIKKVVYAGHYPQVIPGIYPLKDHGVEIVQVKMSN